MVTPPFCLDRVEIALKSWRLEEPGWVCLRLDRSIPAYAGSRTRPVNMFRAPGHLSHRSY